MANLNTVKFLIEINFTEMIFNELDYINNKEIETLSNNQLVFLLLYLLS